jgi:hypothetical protein
LVGHHDRPVLVPVRVLAGGHAVVVDQCLDLGTVGVGSWPGECGRALGGGPRPAIRAGDL